MKTYVLLLGFVMATTLILMSGTAYGAGNNTPAGALSGMVLAYDYRNPDNTPRTCSGDAVGLTARQYLYGFQRSDGFCAARLFYANSTDEAVDCAKRYCRNCEIEDVTNRYLYSSAVPGVSDPANYCLRR